jgi:SAM-dependent methyltransferase
LDWISAVDLANRDDLALLQESMRVYYANSNNLYYNDIDFTAAAWVNDDNYNDIARRLLGAKSILEVGCGVANFVKHHGEAESRYAGCDFSPKLIQRNRDRFPKAEFRQITDPRVIPFEDKSVDAVLSIYVIEHTVYPHDFLSECARVLKPGGTFILKCPDFLGSSSMTSQRAGLSYGTGRAKLAKGRVLDALLTGYDRKVTIPRRCAELRSEIGNGWRFYVNLAPTCFRDPFAPDHDAVYLTYADEMVSFLRGKIFFPKDWRTLNSTWPIYLAGNKM